MMQVLVLGFCSENDPHPLCGTLAAPTAGEGEVLVRVAASSVNAYDVAVPQA